MSDLVKRLRSYTVRDPMRDEAADRIERLEAQLAAADALAKALEAYNRAGAGPLTGWIDVEETLTAYREARE